MITIYKPIFYIIKIFKVRYLLTCQKMNLLRPPFLVRIMYIHDLFLNILFSIRIDHDASYAPCGIN